MWGVSILGVEMRLWREGLWSFGREFGKMGAGMGDPEGG